MQFSTIGLIDNMSSKLPLVLSATDEEIRLLLAAQCHIGAKNCEKHMEPYVWKRRVDGVLCHFLLRKVV
jgi:ribosomal protein S2